MVSSYDDWTVQQLKWTLKERGLPVSGNKPVLIERLESNEGLEGSSKGKNFFEEWAANDKDADLVEQIREKYRAPDYRAPEIGNENVQVLNLAIIALCIVGIFMTYFFTVYRQMEGAGLVNFPCVTALIVSGAAFHWITRKAEESNVGPFTASTSTSVLLLLIIVTGLQLGWTFWEGMGDSYYASEEDDAWLFFYCCSSVFLLVIPFMALAMKSDNDATSRASPAGLESRKGEHMGLWENARDYEKYGQFDAATGIWSKLGEKGEVERIAGLKAEYLCVLLKRKIMDLTEQGADCTQLEEQLAMIETTLEGSASSLSSISMERKEETLTVEDSTITPSPDIDLEEHTGESLKEIEEEEHTLVKDSGVSQISADPGEDDKFDKLKELIEMKEKGLIDDDEFKQMMMDIMGTESEE